MSDDKVQQVFDEWPDSDPLLPYDDFFVGGASDQHHPCYGAKSFASQLLGV